MTITYKIKPVFTGTSLSGEGHSEASIVVKEGTSVTDHAFLKGENILTAEGTVTYKIYSDSECKKLVKEAGTVKVSEGLAPESEAANLPPGTYFWQASYSGDESNQASSSKCGAEVLTVTPAPKPTTLTTSLSGEGQSGEKISVDELVFVTDHATLSGENAAEAKGTVTYHVYLDPGCKDLSAALAPVNVSEGSVPESEPVERSSGIYYWQAEYSGDEHNEKSISKCGRGGGDRAGAHHANYLALGRRPIGPKHHRARRDPRHRSGDVELFPHPHRGSVGHC